MYLLLSLLFFTISSPSPQFDSTKVDQIIRKAGELQSSDCDSALAILNQLDKDYTLEPLELAEYTLLMAKSNYCLGNYDESLQFYQSALKNFEAIEDYSTHNLILNLIGTLHKKQGDRDVALKYFSNAAEIAMNKNLVVDIGNSLNNMGLVYLEKLQFDSALIFFKKSNLYKETANDTLGLSYNYDNMAQTFYAIEEYDSAYQYFKLAIDYKKIVGETVGLAIVQNNLGELLLMRNKLEEAEPYFQKSLSLARELSFKDFEKHVLLKLSELNEKRNDNATALSLYKQHIGLKDSLFNIQRSKFISELETKYETEKRERELEEKISELNDARLLLFSIVVLFLLLAIITWLQINRTRLKQEKNLELERNYTKQAQIEAAISSQEEERKRFARDLHDGFGQMISVLNLNLSNLDANPENRQEVYENSTEVLDQMYKELKSICFNLMPETLIKNGLKDAINEFSSRINNAGKIQIETNFFGLENRLTDIQEISLYRITQEWVNNVIKYASAKNITIQLTKDEEELNLLIEDDGMGFDKSLLTKGSGNGWKNLNSRANLIKGELELDTVLGRRGTTMIVVAPELVLKQNTVLTV